MKALESHQQSEWARMAWGLCWIVNSMPNFGKKRRDVIPLRKFNPLAPQRRRQTGTERDAAFDALWDAATEAPK